MHVKWSVDRTRCVLAGCMAVASFAVAMPSPPASASLATQAASDAVEFPLANPGFEGDYVAQSECPNVTGDVAPGWGDNTCWDTSAPEIRYARDDTNPHGGTSSQKITLARGSRVQFGQFLGEPLDSTRRYTVSAWMRAETTTYVTVYVRQSGEPYAGFTSEVVKLTSEWSEVVLEASTPDSAAVLLFSSTAPGTFWIDDVSIRSDDATSSPPPTPTASVPREMFGMHFNVADTSWSADKGIGTVRIWDAGPNGDNTGVGSQWSEIEGSAGAYDWSGLDLRVAQARERGADVLYTLGGRTPQWAAAQPDGASPYGPGQCSEPSSDQVWQDWVRAIATRYKGQITLWEVWNEPDLADFYCGTPDQLVDLARQAYTVLKEVDPANRVLSPGFSGYQGPGYLDYFLAQGGGDYADIVSYHFYAATPEDAVGWRWDNIQSVLRSNGADAKPLWNTEQGWIDVPAARPIPQATGAAYVARMYLLSWAVGIDRAYYYTWDNQWNQFQFAEPDGVTLTEAGTAYREVATWMTGAAMESLTTDASGTYIATLRTAGGAVQHVAWNPRQQAQLDLPASWATSSRRTLTGVVTDIAGQTSITVGESPLLLEPAVVTAQEVVVDNAGAGRAGVGTTFTGRWCRSRAAGPYGTSSLYSCGTGRDTYRWTPTVPAAGDYEVYVWWPRSSTRSTRVPFTVVTGGASTTKQFDQRTTGGDWVLHGTYAFDAGTVGYIEVSDANGRAGAVRLVPLP
jgi:Cellulase (glycosyl hydrolase family 5)/Carbohydrate binding domain